MGKALIQWWRKWAAIDITVFGSAILSTTLYLFYRYNHPFNNDPLLDIWSNVTTDLLFAWITIRLIDSLIKRRDHRDDARRTLAGNLNYTIDIMRVFLPKAYKHDLERLKVELYWAKRRFDRRKRYLNLSEQEKTAVAYNTLDKFIMNAEKLSTNKVKELKLRRQLSKKLNEINDLRSNLSSNLEEVIRNNNSGSKSKIDVISKASQLIESSKNILSNQEFIDFSNQIMDLGRESGRFNADRSMKNWPYLENIYEHKIEWDDKVQYILNDLSDESNLDHDILIQKIQTYKLTLPNKDYPELLTVLLGERLDAVEVLIYTYKEVELSTNIAIDAFICARDDILEETEID